MITATATFIPADLINDGDYMSLTRGEWDKMWYSVKYLENFCIRSKNNIEALKEIKKIKALIESVIGQIE